MKALLLAAALLAASVDARAGQKVLAAAEAGRPIVSLSALNAHGGHGSMTISRPLGAASGDIPDERFTSSSTHRAQYSIFNPWLARAHARHSDPSDGCWRPAKNAVGEYLQVDLGREYLVTGLATQGAPDGTAWVTKYKLLHSRDLIAWKQYPGEFTGNVDGDTIVINDLHDRITARYVRFVATGWNAGGGIALRAEVYGYSAECEASEEERVVGVPCAKSASAVAAARMGVGEGEANVLVPAPERKYTRGFPLGLEAGLIADGQLTASSVYVAPKPIRDDPICEAVLKQVRSLIPTVPEGAEEATAAAAGPAASGGEVAGPARFMQVGVAVAEGEDAAAAAEADAEAEADEEESEEVDEEGEEQEEEGAAPAGSQAIGAGARFASVSSATEAGAEADKPKKGSVTIREDGKPDCGVYMKYAPAYGRLNALPQPAKSGGWKAGNNAAGEYLQVDLGSVQEIDAVATQGRENSEDWVTAFELQYSINGRTWEILPTIFAANSDSRTLIKHVLPRPLLTRYVRFVVKGFHFIPPKVNDDGEEEVPSRGGIGMRVEVYGPGKGQGCLLRCHAARLALHSSVNDIEAELAAANGGGAVMLELGTGAGASAAALADLSAVIGVDASAAINCCGCPCCSAIKPNSCRGASGATARRAGRKAAGGGKAIKAAKGKAGGKAAAAAAAGVKGPLAVVQSIGGGAAVPVQAASAASASAEAAAIADTVRVLLRGNTPGGGEGPAFAGNTARTAVAAEDRKVAAAVAIPGAGVPGGGAGKVFYVVQKE